jgi:hypothetical protein
MVVDIGVYSLIALISSRRVEKRRQGRIASLSRKNDGLVCVKSGSR